MSRHGLTLPIGTTQQSTAYVCTDTDRDRYLATVHTNDVAGAVTRPSGEPRRLEHSSSERRLAGFSDRQRKAKEQLERYWHDALPGMAKPAGYRSHTGQGMSGEHHLSPEEHEATAFAWRAYDAAMDEVTRQCGHTHRSSLFNAAIEGIPPDMDHAWRVRECLTVLADFWRVK